MKLDINKKEYLTLVQLLELGRLMITQNEIPGEPHPETQHYNDLLQKVYAFAEEMGYGDHISYHKKYKEYMCDREFEQNIERYVYEHNEDRFWFYLTINLSRRDAIEIHGAEKMKNMTIKKYIETMMPFEEEYDNEFAEHGINRLRIVEG